MNITILILFLFLAHFLADFIFQPNKLVSWKYNSFVGICVHSGIHFLTDFLILLLIFNPIAAVLTALIIAFTHAIVDRLKIIQENKNIKHYTAFWVDQIVHWLVLLLVISFITKGNLFGSSPFLKEPLFNLFPYDNPLQPILIIYFILVIFISKTMELSRFQQEQDKNKNAHLTFNRRTIIKRLFYLTLIFLFILSYTTLL